MQSSTLAAVLALSLSALPSATLPKPFIVAVVDGDGRLLPVARFDGRRWRTTWTLQLERHEPLPFSRVGEIPESWLGGAVPQAWAVLDRDGWRIGETIGVGRSDRCIGPLVLRTTAGGTPDRETAFRLAFDSPQAVEHPDAAAVERTISRVRTGLPTFAAGNPDARLRALGVLHVRGRTIWAIEIVSGGSAVVMLADVSPRGVRQIAVADTGGC